MDSRLGKQIKELVGILNSADVQFALIGGLALASYNVVRATQDIDLLIDANDAEKTDALLTGIGYQCLHRSKDAGNYQRTDERVDFLYASRPISHDLLNTAATHQTSFGIIRVVNIEGLIGFKLQAIVNNPRRTQDIEDIRALIRNNQELIDMNRIREYFRLFGREIMLDELINDIS